MTKPSHPYYQINYKHTKRVQLQCNDPSLAKQSFQKECDINTIMSKYQKTGLISHVAKHQGSYDDLPTQIDYHASQNAIIAADAAFASLPSSVRSQFQNDPAAFLDFAQDPSNEDEMREMGLYPKLTVAERDADSLPTPSELSATPEDTLPETS